MKQIKIAVKGAIEVPYTDLHPFQGELKDLSRENYERLKNEILTDDFSFTIHIWKDPDDGLWKILDGHQRLRTVKTMVEQDGYKCPPLPCSIVQAKSYKQAKHKLLAAASQYGEMNKQGLYEFINDAEIDLEEMVNHYHFPEIDLDSFAEEYLVDHEAEQAKEEIEDDVPTDVETRCKPGDLWQLGEHRLLCGDSTNIQHVEELMDGEKADMVFTDPPYGVNYDGGIQFTKDGVKKGQREKLENDHSEDIYTNSIPVMSAYCDGPIYTWYAASRGKQLYNAIYNCGGDYHAMIVWVKNGGYGALNASYKQKHEPCVFWKPKGKTLKWCGPTTENTIWEINKDGKNKMHPTQKPVALAERAIKNHKSPKVLDLFGGSGSTLIACEKTNRKCFMMELDPRYCDVIIKRWEDYSGGKASLIK